MPWHGLDAGSIPAESTNFMNKPKILCVCQGGNVRSVGFAKLLKDAGADALACGARDNSIQTLAHLFNWADIIVLMSEQIKEHLPEYLLRPVFPIVVIEVGPDNYHKHTHPELLAKLKPVVEEWKRNHWHVDIPGPVAK